MNSIDLSTLALKPGEGRRMDVEIQPEGLRMGGFDYDFGRDPVPARLEVSRTSTGHALHLTASATLSGPCMKCLTASENKIDIDTREVDQPGTGDEELESPYVDDGHLDVAAWAHDAIALAVPQALLCRPDCAGLCPECGVSLNDVDPATHVHEKEPDPRWDKLRELMD